MKKILVLIICIAIFTSMSFATNVPTKDIEEILACMDIMDELNNNSVTRAELAEILVKVSQYKSLATASIRISPFSDVSFTNEYASYVNIIGQKGIMTAYSDGEFKPTKPVLYEEAITTILKLLGYTSEDFAAGYPYAQIMIASDIGLIDNITVNIGTVATREVVGKLVYNTLACNNKSGQNYAKSIGYTLTGEVITLNDVMVNVTGPVTATANTKNTLFGMIEPKVYIDGKEGEIIDISEYDILYYSTKSNSIWVYKDKITGVVESISPNKEAPTSVVISGKTYKLSTYSAQKAFGINGIETGKMATLLLDRNSEAADAYLTADLYKEQVGVITATGRKEVIDANGNTKNSYYATVLLSTGEKIDISTSSNYSKKVGYTAKVTYNAGVGKIASTSKVTELSGTFNSSSNTIGKNKISKTIKILEVDDYGNTTAVISDRLNGVYLNSGDIAMVTKDTTGAIDSMIIKNVTGDTANYGVITKITKDAERGTESYTYVINGTEKTYSSSETGFNVEKGPVAIFSESQSIEMIKNLIRVEGSITEINNLYVTNSKGDTYKLSGNLTVYNTDGITPVISSIDEAMNGEYNISAYYDDIEKNGGLVRIIYIN